MKTVSFLRSLHHAWRGVRYGIQTERNLRIQISIGLVAVLCSWFFSVSKGEKIIVLVVVMGVVVLELLNTAVERLIDLMKPRLIDAAGDIKDVMAGAVLVASLFAVAIGATIFGPPFFSLISHI